MSITDFSPLADSGSPEPKIRPLASGVPRPFKQIASFWQGLSCTDHAVPHYDQLDLLELAEFLTNVSILELNESHSDFTYRYYGTNVVAMTGFDPTGRALTEVAGDGVGEKWGPVIRHVVETRRPYAFQTAFGEINRGHIVANCLLAPLSDRNGRTTHFLGYTEDTGESG